MRADFLCFVVPDAVVVDCVRTGRGRVDELAVLASTGGGRVASGGSSGGLGECDGRRWGVRGGFIVDVRILRVMVVVVVIVGEGAEGVDVDVWRATGHHG